MPGSLCFLYKVIWTWRGRFREFRQMIIQGAQHPDEIKMLFGSPTFGFHLAVFYRLRPYHVENTRSRPISEVKLRRAQLVLTWVTGWEY